MKKPVLLVLCLIRVEIAGMTSVPLPVHQEGHFISTRVGETITLKCFLEHLIISRFYWYKQPPGREPRLISAFYKYQGKNIFHGEFANNSRFTVDTDENKFHLRISRVRTSDSANYYCASSFIATIQFADGVTVSVEGPGSNTQTWVQSGDSETLSCPIHKGPSDGGHSVHWFITSDKTHQGLIYPCETNSDQCERNLSAQTHTCAYRLPVKSLNVSHADTDYCAVASCEHVLFGNRANLDFKEKVSSVVSVHFLSGTVAFCDTLSVLLGFCVWGMKRKKSCNCAETAARPTHPFSGNAEVIQFGQSEDHLHGNVTVREKKLNSQGGQKNDTWSQCVYFSVKQ